MHFLSCGYPEGPWGRREDMTEGTNDLFRKPREGARRDT
jgi:hypothetical protein